MSPNRKILIAGSGGQLASEFVRVLQQRRWPFSAPAEDIWNITDSSTTAQIIEKENPRIIINGAAYNQVDSAEDERELAFKVNATAVENLAEVCAQKKIFLVHFGSDYVFDGEKKDLYTEEDKLAPRNIYGLSKLQGEEAVRAVCPEYLLFRLSWVFGSGPQNFLFKLRQWAASQDELRIASDEISVPTYTVDIVGIVLSALEKGLSGLYHLTNSGSCSRFEWAEFFFRAKGEQKKIRPVPLSSFLLKARRPVFSAMSNRKISEALGTSIPTWEDATERFVRTAFSA